ncbi:hypothetical protein V6V47_08260 [Micromonospora sp. CPCC 205539]|uniref:hypothetical protein n=1 Tax=Micromonospora sp. CPCC 205539 TaxID=3122408 RepID=UPI002FF179F3
MITVLSAGALTSELPPASLRLIDTVSPISRYPAGGDDPMSVISSRSSVNPGTKCIDRPSYAFPYIDTFVWDGNVMPIQPNDRCQQDPDGLWPAAEGAERFPIQPRYRRARAGGSVDLLPWSELNKLPVGSSSRHGLNTR